MTGRVNRQILFIAANFEVFGDVGRQIMMSIMVQITVRAKGVRLDISNLTLARASIPPWS